MDDERLGCAEEQVDETSGLWTRCAAPLRDQVSDTVWQMWLSNIEPVSYDGRTMVLGVPNTVVRERVEGRFLPLIAQTISSAAGHDVDIRLEVGERSGAANGAADRSAPDAPLAGTATGAGERAPGRDDRVRLLGEQPRVGAAVSLDPRFTFESFVAASSNRLAHAAAQAVAETPGRSYNPLFIYGDSGLGKTHLLHAIGNYLQENFSTRTVLYVTTETFMNDFVDSLRMSTTIAFKRRYRECDVLLIDDVQFMENKEGLQEEFFHTYNDLHGAGKQIVLTSDRPPKSIETLEDRLRSRFLSGLITEVDPPDLETRLAILRKKAEADHDDIPDDVLDFIATHVKNNIRELEGALIRVSAFASLSREPISLELAERVLADIVSSVEPRRITPQMILDATAASYGFTIDALCGPSRTRPLVTARQVAMYLVRNLTDYSYPAIARVFGGRDHTTVIHAVDKITTHMKERRQLYEQVTELTVKIRNGT
ncbi:MAG TPA: chromosomal replication initiator protein DnaA [Acidimicrobiales bacterium]|nr:chromosomal replication initiator protein DnaA [Acidimicrobiales bacterium]